MSRIYYTIIAVIALAASVAAQVLPEFELTEEWEAKIEGFALPFYAWIGFGVAGDAE